MVRRCVYLPDVACYCQFSLSASLNDSFIPAYSCATQAGKSFMSICYLRALPLLQFAQLLIASLSWHLFVFSPANIKWAKGRCWGLAGGFFWWMFQQLWEGQFGLKEQRGYFRCWTYYSQAWWFSWLAEAQWCTCIEDRKAFHPNRPEGKYYRETSEPRYGWSIWLGVVAELRLIIHCRKGQHSVWGTWRINSSRTRQRLDHGYRQYPTALTPRIARIAHQAATRQAAPHRSTRTSFLKVTRPSVHMFRNPRFQRPMGQAPRPPKITARSPFTTLYPPLILQVLPEYRPPVRPAEAHGASLAPHPKFTSLHRPMKIKVQDYLLHIAIFSPLQWKTTRLAQPALDLTSALHPTLTLRPISTLV